MNYEALKRISEVMKVEATTSSVEDFLLTHTPFENLYLESEKEYVTEDFILDRILLENQDEHKFILIQGDNGSGKSHLIRWLKEKYVAHVDQLAEGVLLISRAHNTLQDALKQLLESDIFPEEFRENELKIIKNAEGSITSDVLKRTINFNFQLEIKDDVSKSDLILDLRRRNWLESYLKNEFIIENFLIKTGGPLDRIRAKIESNKDEKVNFDESPIFTESDFDITVQQILGNLKSGNNKAEEFTIKLAEDFTNGIKGSETKKRVAEYLNTKVSSVIRKSLKLQSSDFKELFASLRRFLKNRNMNLTLFVEDINSFTGIDEALMEVLLTDHNAEGNDAYCRIISVVGSTTAFYRNKLNNSIKERIKSNISISENSVLGDRVKLSAFVARYINAVMVSRDAINYWKKSKYHTNTFPFHDSDIKWAKTEIQGKNFSIFPFNENALWNLYSSLEESKKTPRIVIRSILMHLLTLWYSNPEAFLWDERKFNTADISLPNWKNIIYDVSNRKLDETNVIPRGILLRLWGNGTTDRIDGKLGGLETTVFETFGIKLGNTELIVSKQEETQIESTPIKEVKSDVISSEQRIKLNKVLDDLNDWLNKGTNLTYHVELRDLLSDFVYSSIDWEVENVPEYLAISNIKTRTIINIEGQNIAFGNGIKLARNIESRFLLEAIVSWKYIGENSWFFENSDDLLITALAWLNRNKCTFIDLAIKPREKVTSWNIDLHLISALYVRQIFLGRQINTRDIESMYFSLLSNNQEQTFSSHHSFAWNEFREEILINSKTNDVFDVFLMHFSKAIGSASPGSTKYRFIDAEQVIKNLEIMVKKDFDFGKLIPSEVKRSNELINVGSNILVKFINEKDIIINSEFQKYSELKKFFIDIFDNPQNYEEVSTTTDEILKFLSYLLTEHNMSYNQSDYIILFDSNERKGFINQTKHLYSDVFDHDFFDLMNYLSSNPFDILDRFFITLQRFEKFIEEKNSLFLQQDVTTTSSIKSSELKLANDMLKELIMESSIIGGTNNDQ